MAILEIKKYNNPVLRALAPPVEKVAEEEKKLFVDIADTMRTYNGIGLAAPQVGISKRMIVADAGQGLLYLANPEIIKKEGQEKMEEGCLSLPEVCVEVKRAKKITIRGLNENSKEVKLEFDGLMAVVIQHEIDHLNGVLIIDHLGFIAKILTKKKIKRLSRDVKKL